MFREIKDRRLPIPDRPAIPTAATHHRAAITAMRLPCSIAAAIRHLTAVAATPPVIAAVSRATPVASVVATKSGGERHLSPFVDLILT